MNIRLSASAGLSFQEMFLITVVESGVALGAVT